MHKKFIFALSMFLFLCYGGLQLVAKPPVSCTPQQEACCPSTDGGYALQGCHAYPDFLHCWYQMSDLLIDDCTATSGSTGGGHNGGGVETEDGPPDEGGEG